MNVTTKPMRDSVTGLIRPRVPHRLFFMFVFFFILLFISNVIIPVEAIGVRPAKISFFVAGTQQYFNVTLLTADAPKGYVLEADGPLSPYLIFDKQFHVSSGTSETIVPFIIDFKNLNEKWNGPVSSKLIISETSSENTKNVGGVSATTAIAVLLEAWFPYPSKYLDITDFFVQTVLESVEFEIPIVNHGSEILDAVKAVLVIRENTGKFIAELSSSPIRLVPGQQEKIILTSDALQPGLYNASLTVFYDGHTIEMEKSFLIGKPSLIIGKPIPGFFTWGDIARVTIPVKNAFSIPVEQLQLSVKDTRRNIVVESAPESFNDYEEKNVTVFIETDKFKPEDFTTVFVHARHELGEQEVEFSFEDFFGKPQMIPRLGTGTLWVVSIVAFVLFLLSIFTFIKYSKLRRI